MAPLDSTAFLPDISGDQPAGENLEFDPAFTELERLAAGKPEQQYGTTIVPAEEPEWRQVATAARALVDRTHDLRVMAQLAVARLHTEGLDGWSDTLALVRQLLETRWEAVHPQLDPDDDLDPTLRANALLALASPLRVVRTLRTLPLARSPRTGAVSWRDLAVANGTAEATPDATPLTEAAIAGVFRDTDPAALAALREAVASAMSSLAAIPAAFDANAGYGTGPDFSDVGRLLREMGQMMATHAPAGNTPVEDVPAEAPGDAAAPATPRATGQAIAIATMGPPTNRADALRLLDLVATYYERNEPSSPLPLLIARARRLADKTFMDILRDMAPDGVSQAERIAGTTSTE